MPTDVYLYDAVRTPFGKYGGALAGVRPDDLAAHVVQALVGRAPALDPARVDEIVLGNANGAGEDNRNVASAEAANAALKRAGIGWGDVDAVELNEAFAAQAVACINAWASSPTSSTLIIHAGRWLPRSVPRIAATAEILASGYGCSPAGGPGAGVSTGPGGSLHRSQGRVGAGQLVSGSAQIRCQARVIASAQGQFAANLQRRRRPPRTRRAAAFRTR
jgi:Thiolase, N-terminal domain